MSKLKFSNIFDAITDDSDEAADLEFRADLMLLLREYFKAHKASQTEIGTRLGVPQPRVSELLAGKIDKFSSDKLIGFLAKAGIRLKPHIVPATTMAAMKITCEVSISA